VVLASQFWHPAGLVLATLFFMGPEVLRSFMGTQASLTKVPPPLLETQKELRHVFYEDELIVAIL